MRLILLLMFGTTGLVFAQQKKRVVATASIFADMAKNIAGDHLDIQTIVPIGGDPHIYEPTPADAQLVARADLILKNGLTFEGWLNKLIEHSASHAKVALITKGIDPIQSKKYKNATDPHAWMAPSNGLIYIENIKNALIELDPDNREVYEFNYGVYRQQMEDLDKWVEQEIQKIPEQRRILITSHDSFHYFGRRYGIRLESVLGISTQAEAQTSDIVRLNKVIRENKVPAVFIETTINPKFLEQLAKDNHIKIGGSLYSDSIGEPDSPAPTYLDMIRYNTQTIVAALSAEPEAPTAGATDSATRPWVFWVIGLGFVAVFVFVLFKMNAHHD
ncbi:MAG: metal ABC transporter substrate-binding protein [Bacteroidetes bacterium]|nr:MAG: metal ABC transporter substrate-binding protein [Bacteroidota bacterium]